MNRDEILAMEPGRGLDALVAEKVMGWKDPWKPFFPSTDISAAWEVAEKAESYKLSKLPDGDTRIKYGGQYQCFLNANINCGYGDTAPLAICRAALLSLIEEDKPCTTTTHTAKR